MLVKTVKWFIRLIWFHRCIHIEKIESSFQMRESSHKWRRFRNLYYLSYSIILSKISLLVIIFLFLCSIIPIELLLSILSEHSIDIKLKRHLFLRIEFSPRLLCCFRASRWGSIHMIAKKWLGVIIFWKLVNLTPKKIAGLCYMIFLFFHDYHFSRVYYHRRRTTMLFIKANWLALLIRILNLHVTIQ